MGASKKLMEELIMAYSDRLPIKTARFANVAFSNGSLPLGFIDRLNKQQPWSCPLSIRRFFVSPQESGELCLMASIMGESGDIFFPKLDEERDMIPFDKIALDLLNYLGLEAEICQSEDEARTKTQKHKDTKKWPIYFLVQIPRVKNRLKSFSQKRRSWIMIRLSTWELLRTRKKRSINEIDEIFDRLHNLFESNNVTKAAIVEILKVYLPNFEHIETGKGLDSKM